jgi:hypothetical protein
MAGELEPQPVPNQQHNQQKQPTALTRLNTSNSRSAPLSTLTATHTAAINGRTPNECRGARKRESKRSVVVSSAELV